MTHQPEQGLIDRKYIAVLINTSPRQVGRNEKRWGLDAARVDLTCRTVRYRAKLALRILKKFL